MDKWVKIGLNVFGFIICVFMIVSGQRNIGYTGLLIMLVGLLGLLALLFEYNHR